MVASQKVLANTFETTKQGAKLASQDNAEDCVVQACNDIAAGCKATAPLKTALSRNDLPQRLGQQTVKAKLGAAIICSIGKDGFRTAARANLGATSEPRKAFCAYSMKARQNFCATSIPTTTCTFASAGKDICICRTMRRFR